MDQTQVDEIRQAIAQVRQDAMNGMNKAELEKKHLAFCDRYPALFMRCCNPDEPLDMVHLMLETLLQHDTTQAAGKEMGQFLVEKYVKPRLNKVYKTQ